MIYSHCKTRTYQRAGNGDGHGGSLDFTFPWDASIRYGKKSIAPTALVVSSDEDVVQELAEITEECGLAAFLAFTVGEGKRILEKKRVSVVVCDDRLIDGQYADILSETARLRLKTPVIVVSPTGDWSDYLKAISAGAFDYLAFPAIPGDLARTVHDALTSPAARILKDRASNFFVL